ncbi:ComEC/Rec2 family competence protein [Shimia aestuarii]|uniref:ComEC/Rec2 family competence protein n=1 Tax=Shimia aestuarii TaxID=254406 RepID=UPI001FB1D8BF|nr:ComEC/Rec2 family competence protein [Shimia aestuarii]
MQLLARIGAALQGQRGYLFPWAPVCLALGIGAFFLSREEPSVLFLGVCGAMAFAGLGGVWALPEAARPLALGVAFCLLGVAIAGVRAHRVAAPVLDWRYYGPVEGRIVGIDRSASDALRLTLDRVVLARVVSEKVPKRVRVALHGDQRFIDPKPHMTVILTGHLAPPSGPVEPGGFDFKRHAWFQGIGAIGYTRVPVLALAPAPDRQSLLRLRLRLSDAIRNRLSGETGALAAAVTTGDRSGVPQSTLEALRASNLAHLLAISGLHMGLLVGFVFASLRYGMALHEWSALYLPTKKIAAMVALGAATGYLLLSGGNVATERAYAMAAVALLAVMVDRRAISLRAVAVAAMVVLMLRPEAMLGPGFQMSFAATTALVAVFEILRKRGPLRIPRFLRPVFAVAVSSLVAGLATAPFGAAHFNTVSHYGLVANLLAVPIMGTVVVPSAVVAACLAPIGLEAVGLVPMGLGLDAILWVARWVAGLEGAVGHVPRPPAAVLPLLALGMLWAILWQGRARCLGAVPVLVAGVLWIGTERPLALIADTGGLVGVMQETGARALSKPRGAGFVARNWLENDGDGADQADAAARWGAGEGRVRKVELGGLALWHVFGKREVAALADCPETALVVLSHDTDTDLPCDVWTPARLRKSGAVALYARKDGLQMKTARDISGRRMWNTRALRPQ